MPTSTIKDVLAKIQSASLAPVLNSDYDIIWSGTLASTLNAYNESMETVNIPGTAISTNESRTASSLVAKIASELTFEDLEITWRMPQDFGLLKEIRTWMNAVKPIIKNGNSISVKTGDYNEYCVAQSCTIRTVRNPVTICTIDGLFPTNAQSIQFSAEGGDVVKLTATFSVRRVEML